MPDVHHHLPSVESYHCLYVQNIGAVEVVGGTVWRVGGTSESVHELGRAQGIAMPNENSP
jgi:hypothetical protein